MKQWCNGCGRTGEETTAFQCTWPDGRITTERHCPCCRLTWHRQLKTLGARLDLLEAPLLSLRADMPLR